MSRPPGSRFGKPDHTGRSSGKLTGRLKELKAPKTPFAWLHRELVTSAAWRARSIHTARFIDALLVDYMNHAGNENGNLKATYDQMVAWGIGRRFVNDAIAEAVFLGLARVDPGGRWVNTNQPSRYCLTWFYNDRDDTPATDDWKKVTKEAIKMWRKGRRRRAKKTDPRFTHGALR